MLQVLARGGLFALDDEVLAPEVDRVDAEVAGDVVQVRLDREDALRVAGSAHEAARDLVRVDEARLDADVGDAVGPRGLVRAPDGAEGLERGVGAGVDEVLDLVGDERAVLLHAGLELRDRVVARVAGAELLDVVTHDLHGAPGGLRQVVGDRRVAGVALAAEVAADVGVVEEDGLFIDAGGGGKGLSRVVGHLAAEPDVHAAVIGVDVDGDRLGLQVALVHALRRVSRLVDEVGLCEAGFDVAPLPVGLVEDVGRLVLLLTEAEVVVEVGVQDRRIRGHGVEDVEDGRQLLVLDVDQGDRGFGGVLVLGGDGRDALAGPAHLVHGDHGHVLDGATPQPGIGNVAAGDHGDDPRQRQRLRRVDADDASVRVRALQRPAPERAGQRHVGGVLRRAGDLLDAVDAAKGALADYVEVGHGGCSVFQVCVDAGVGG